jgi:hypothetical protein
MGFLQNVGSTIDNGVNRLVGNIGPTIDGGLHRLLGDRYPESKEMTPEQEKKFQESMGKKKGGVISASNRADGIAQRGKTRGKMC